MAERWGSGVVAAIGAAAGGVSGAAASLVAGSDRLPVGTLIGVVTGALVAVALWWAVRDTAQAAELVDRSEPGTTTPGSRTFRAPGSGDPGIDSLVDTIGRQFDDLAVRQLEVLDHVRRNPTDREALARAAKVALRTRRKAAALQVLATGGTSEPLGQDATDEPVAEVLERALADSDQAHRVDVTSLHDATIDRTAVVDVAFLMAELIDNAVSSSAEPVTVVGRRGRDGYVLSVVDEGPGLSAEDRRVANDRLTDPPPLSLQGPGAFGLSVAGRLAARHGIAVQLLESATDGLIAKVRLPLELIDGGRHLALENLADDHALDGTGEDEIDRDEDNDHDAPFELTDPTVEVRALDTAGDATTEVVAPRRG